MYFSEVREAIFGYGHENIQGTHKTTLQFTKDKHLTKKGDCIVAVSVNRALADLSDEFKERLRKPHAKLNIVIEASGLSEKVNACGSPTLILGHTTDMVIRKSKHVCNRTLAIRADKAARDLSRSLIEKLKDPKNRVKITLAVHN